MPSLAIAILVGLTSDRHRITVVNDLVEEIPFGGDFDLVCITVMTVQAPRAYQVADRFRANGAKVVLGGIHPTFMLEEAAQHADAVVVGEAEPVWERLLEDFEAGRLNCRYIPEGHPPLDRQVNPGWQHFNMKLYRNSAGSSMPRIPVYTTRGCLYGCSFCSVSKAYGRTHRHKPIANVIEEVDESLADTYFFVDDNIVCNFDYAEELFKGLCGKNVRWLSQASMQLFKRPDLINLAAKSGCKSLFLGIESISQETLKGVKKGFNKPDSYPEFFELLHRSGIRPLVSMIIGLDQDTPEDVERTLEFLIEQKIQNVYLSIYTPLPGTDVYTEMKRNGRIIERDWSKYDLSHVVHQPINFTPEALESTYWQVYGRLYSFGAIMRRTAGSLSKLRGDRGKALRDILVQIHMNAQIRNREHLQSLGVGRIR
ncbi:MAG: radical SAM protein [Desulfuromonadales bacterium]